MMLNTNLQNPSVPILRKSNTKLSREARHQLKTLTTPTSKMVLLFGENHLASLMLSKYPP